MKQNLIRTIFIPGLLSLLSTTAAHADGGMTLNEAVNSAFQNSPQLQKSKSSAEEASWKRVEAFSTYMPTLTGGVTYLTDKKYVFTDLVFGGAPTSVPGIVPTSNFSLTAQYLVFDGFASTNRYQASKSMESAANKDYDWNHFQTEKQVSLQFYRTIASKLLEEVAEQNVRTLEDHLKDTGLFKKAGLSTNYDVLRVEVQVSEAKSEILNSQDNIELAKGRLAEMLGQDQARDVVGELPVLGPEVIQSVTEDAIESRQDIQALQNVADGANHLEAAAGRHWVPQVSLFGTYNYYNNINDRFNDWNNFRNAYQVGVTLNWNLFDGFASTARSHQKTEQHFQSEKNLQALRLKARQDFNFWKRKYLYFCTVYRSRLSDVQKSKESVRLAREGRRVGARTNTDLLDAEVELFRAQAGAVNAQMGSVEALINLELVTGRPLLGKN